MSMMQRGFMDEYDTWVTVMLLAVVAASFGIPYALARNSCRVKWADSGFQTDYGVIAGCRISKDGVHWIPSDNYRGL